jgi:hypothetical protein
MSNNSWRSYGGTNKNDNLQNISIGTLVADSLLLRQNYATEFTVQGSMQVLGDATIQGNATIKRNFILGNGSDIFANRDVYINENLYFGRTSDQGVAQYGYSFIHGGSNQIGVNTTTPYTTFDITDITGSDNVLTVRSQTAVNRNIIAENNARHGIISYTKDDVNSTYSSIQFYNNATINNQISTGTAVQVPDSIIQYKWFTGLRKGILDIQGGYIHLDASCTVISSRGYSEDIDNYFKESAIVYDSNNSTYRYDEYNMGAAYSGNALSLIAKDNSSNTFLTIAAPSKIGLAIGGGAFPYDTTRAMGTIGMNLNNTYTPIQTIVSGIQPLYYKNTVGINTYAPKTENYVLDINGPTRIGNGEITTTGHSTIEVTTMAFSRRDPLYGMLCGSPFYTGSSAKPFSMMTTITLDGGKTWQPSMPVDTQGSLTNFQVRPTYMSLYVYDASYSIIGCSTNTISALYYTYTGGQSPSSAILPWYKLTDSGVSSYKSFQTIYVADLPSTPSFNTIGAKRVFLTGIDGNRGNIIYGSYFDVSFGQSFIGTNYQYTGQSMTDLSLASISCCDGCGNILYYAGAGIQKYDIQAASSLQTIQRNDVSYNRIHAYDCSYVVAVGAGMISYTKDGTNWTDISNTTDGSPIGTCNSVFLYDISHALIVGNSGEFLYTTDGAITWAPVPSLILNSSGIGGRITDESNTLTGVNMQDIHTFVISDVSQGFVYVDSSHNQQGSSKIICGFFPNLFDRASNTVFEISGNMFISGDVNINEGGKIMTTNDTFYLLNERVQHIYMGNSTATITTGNQNTATYINGSVFISVDSSLNGNLYVKQKTILYGDTSMNSRVYIGGDTSLNSRLFVNNDLSANSRLYVGGDVSLNSRLYVGGDVSLSSRLFVTNDLSANRRLYVGGDVSLSSRLFISADLSANSRVFVGGDMSLNSRLFISSDLSANSRAFIGGDVSLNARLFVANDLSANTRAFIGGDVSMGGRLYVSSEALIHGLTIGRGYGYLPTNTAIGYQTLPINTTGTTNTALGYQVLYNNTIGSQSVGVGYKSLYSSAGDSKNTAVGHNALYTTNGGSYNTAIGQNAGFVNTSGTYNTFLGYNTNATTGAFSYSTAVGYNASIYGSNQIVLGTVSEQVIIPGDVSVNNRLFVDGEASITSDLYVNQNIFTTNNIYASNSIYTTSEFDTTSPVLYVGTGSYSSQIYIGSAVTGTPKTIYVGSDQDTVILRGNVQNKTVTNLSVNSKQINLNRGDTELGDSAYAGITIRDNGNDMAGYILISQDMSGFVFKPTNDESTRVKFDINSFALDTGMDTGLMILTPGDSADAEYRVTVQPIDCSNILIRDKLLSTDTNQYITTALTLSGGDMSANGCIFVGGDVSLNARLFVNDDVSFNRRTYIGGDVSLNARLFVSDDVSFNTRTYIGGDVSLNGRLFVNDDVSFNGLLYVGGDVSLGSRLFVTSDALINTLTIGLGNGYISTNTALGYQVLYNNTSGDQNTGIGYSALSNNTTGSYNIAIGPYAGQVNTTGAYNTFMGWNTNSMDGLASNSTAIGYNATIYGSNQIMMGTSNETVILPGDTSANGRLFVGGDASLNSRLFVNSDISANTRIFVGGDVSLGSRLFVSLDISADSNLFVGGDVSFGRQLFVSLDISADSNLFVGGDASLGSRLFVSGDTTIGGSNGGIINAVNGIVIGSTMPLGSNTTLDISGNVYQTNGVIFQF